jgi:hypothetical protein
VLYLVDRYKQGGLVGADYALASPLDVQDGGHHKKQETRKHKLRQ